eukprot:m.82088 g.82088  ORF g.82088 m.82088 type:complete len:471 (+) comp25485_c0_seq1:92-1504(+)
MAKLRSRNKANTTSSNTTTTTRKTTLKAQKASSKSKSGPSTMNPINNVAIQINTKQACFTKIIKKRKKTNIADGGVSLTKATAISVTTTSSISARTRTTTAVATSTAVTADVATGTSRVTQYIETLPSTDESNPNVIIIPTPIGFSLAQSICSYGYFGLAPNIWKPTDTQPSEEGPLGNRKTDSGCYSRPLRFGKNHNRVCVVSVVQDRENNCLKVSLSCPVKSANHRLQIKQQIVRITRLDFKLDDFHRLHPAAEARGFGRLFRSPTLWEDLVKTITNCNMQWSGTVDMNKKLCSELGTEHAAFPTPFEVAKLSVDDLMKCRLGYRASWIYELAHQIVDNKIDLSWFEHPSRERTEVVKALKKLKGFGEFAANNMCQLLGLFDSFPYDTETRRLWQEEHGVARNLKGAPSEQLKQRAAEYYGKYAPFQFIGYWFEVLMPPPPSPLPPPLPPPSTRQQQHYHHRLRHRRV